MKVRTFLFAMFWMGVLYLLALVFIENKEILDQRFRIAGEFELPVSVTMLLLLAAGVAIALVAGFTREASRLMDGWRRRKDDRRAERIEEEFTKGLTAVLEGRENEALTHFLAVLEWDSRHFNTLLKLGEVLRHLGRHDEAIEFHRKAHHLSEEDARPLYALVEDYDAKGDMDRARAVLGRIIVLNKHSVSAWRKLRGLHLKQRDWAKALDAHERVEKHADARDPRDAHDRRFGIGIRYEIASELLLAGKPKDTASSLRKILKEDPRFIPASVRLGEALLEQNLETDAVEVWFTGFEQTGSPIFLTLLEEHFLQQERPLQAIEALRRCVSRAKKDTVPRFFLGKLYFRLEMLDDAMAVLSPLVGRASYAPTLHFLLGRIHERRKNYRDAALEYKKVIREMELVQLDYRCRGCRSTSVDWSDRCPTCGEWNTIEVNFREEMGAEALGLAPAPVYPVRT